MKIAFVSHVLPPSWSGQSVMIGRILKNISPTLYCLILTEDFQNEKDKNIEVLPGKYCILPKEPRLFRLGVKYWFINWFRAFFRGACIACIVKLENCDVIVAASGNLIDIPAGWWASILTGARFVPYLFDDYLYQWADKRTRSITRKMEKSIFGRVKCVVVPNEFMRDEIQKRHNVKATIVRNPCASIPEKNMETILTDYNFQSEIRIVYTGAIYHVNFGAFRNLIDATRKISANIKIHIYTAQPMEWLEKNGVTGEQVIQHPHSIHAEVIEAQSRAHILFLPLSFNSPIPEIVHTSAPGKTGEYLASGIPILAHVPPESFVSWYFRKYDCGYVVDVDDVDALKTAVNEIINNLDLRRNLSANAKECARLDFDPILSSQAFIQAMEAAF